MCVCVCVCVCVALCRQISGASPWGPGRRRFHTELQEALPDTSTGLIAEAVEILVGMMWCPRREVALAAARALANVLYMAAGGATQEISVYVAPCACSPILCNTMTSHPDAIALWHACTGTAAKVSTV